MRIAILGKERWPAVFAKERRLKVDKYIHNMGDRLTVNCTAHRLIIRLCCFVGCRGVYAARAGNEHQTAYVANSYR